MNKTQIKKFLAVLITCTAGGAEEYALITTGTVAAGAIVVQSVMKTTDMAGKTNCQVSATVNGKLQSFTMAPNKAGECPTSEEAASVLQNAQR